MTYDLICIGAGPAGLAAALYAARYRMNVLVIGQAPGGTAATAHEVCNYPGFDKISGPDLMMKMMNQVKALDVVIKQEEVMDIVKEDIFRVKTNRGEYSSKKIIIATGSQPRKMGVEREDELTGFGVSYCATCDAGLFKNKVVGVVGGGNAALTAALLLSKFAKKVYIFYRKPSFFRAEKVWVEDAESNDKIESMFETTVENLIGEKKLEKVEVNQKGNVKEIALDGLFVEIGGISNIKLAKTLGIKLEGEYIIVDKEQKTNVHGVFAAGDVTNNPLKQITTACGEGSIATFIAYKEIIKERLKK